MNPIRSNSNLPSATPLSTNHQTDQSHAKVNALFKRLENAPSYGWIGSKDSLALTGIQPIQERGFAIELDGINFYIDRKPIPPSTKVFEEVFSPEDIEKMGQGKTGNAFVQLLEPLNGSYFLKAVITIGETNKSLAIEHVAKSSIRALEMVVVQPEAEECREWIVIQKSGKHRVYDAKIPGEAYGESKSLDVALRISIKKIFNLTT